MDFPLQMLLDLLGLALGVFFYHLKELIKMTQFHKKLCGFIVIIMNVTAIVVLLWNSEKRSLQS